MSIIKNKSSQNILPNFIENIIEIFPSIKEIEHSDEVFKECYDKKAYCISNDSSGIHVYFYNMTSQDILTIINKNDFDDCSINIKSYFNLIKLYNQFLYNIDTQRFNISVNLIDYMYDGDEILFKMRAINQTGSKMLIAYNNNYTLDEIHQFNDVNEDAINYAVSLKDEKHYEFYQEVCQFLKEDLGKYIDVDSIRSHNIKEYVNLIQMITI